MAENKIIQLNQVRAEKKNSLRRQYERFLFDRFLGCYTVIDKLGLKGVEVVDISKSGLSFRMPTNEGHFKTNELFEFRFYFSGQTYLPIQVSVKRVDKIIDGEVEFYQYGCSFDEKWQTYKALEKFIDFIEAFSQNAREDKGAKAKWFF